MGVPPAQLRAWFGVTGLGWWWPGCSQPWGQQGTSRGHPVDIQGTSRGHPSQGTGAGPGPGRVLVPPAPGCSPAARFRCCFSIAAVIQQQTSGRIRRATEIPRGDASRARGCGAGCSPRAGGCSALLGGLQPRLCPAGGCLGARHPPGRTVCPIPAPSQPHPSPVPAPSRPGPVPSPPTHDQVLLQILLCWPRVFEAFVS